MFCIISKLFLCKTVIKLAFLCPFSLSDICTFTSMEPHFCNTFLQSCKLAPFLFGRNLVQKDRKQKEIWVDSFEYIRLPYQNRAEDPPCCQVRTLSLEILTSRCRPPQHFPSHHPRACPQWPHAPGPAPADGRPCGLWMK